MRKPLAEMSREQWEALCDGCARCCVKKFEDVDTREVLFTNVACRLLDVERCRCTSYELRHGQVPDCITLTPESVARYVPWLPPTCAYRRLSEHKALEWWHPLVSGRRESVHEARISVRGMVIPECHIHPSELVDHIVEWWGDIDS